MYVLIQILVIGRDNLSLSRVKKYIEGKKIVRGGIGGQAPRCKAPALPVPVLQRQLLPGWRSLFGLPAATRWRIVQLAHRWPAPRCMVPAKRGSHLRAC